MSRKVRRARRSHRTLILAGVGTACCVMLALFLLPRSSGSTEEVARDPPAFAAPGRIEGATDSVLIGSAMTGIVAAVFVAEGEQVAAGQVLARIECADLEAEVPLRTAEAAAAASRAEIVRLGPRAQEIEAAAAEARLAVARLTEASEALHRAVSLVDSGATTRARLLEAERDERMAAAQLEAANQHLRLLQAGSRPEEVAEAGSRAEAARRAAEMAMAHLARCEIRSPIQGIVLRKQVSLGELVSVFAPGPLFTLADLSRLRVRAEVDEHDIGAVAVGQAATVIPAYADAPHLMGRVTEIGSRMGRRRVLTGDPAEKSDRDVLEVIVDLDGATTAAPLLPIGLRASVIFAPAPTASSSALR